MNDDQMMILKDSLDMLTAATIVNAAYTARLIEIQSGQFDQEEISPLLEETDKLVKELKHLRRVEEICEMQTNQE
jgi:hypothetical protein